jgi:hypothetical protein
VTTHTGSAAYMCQGTRYLVCILKITFPMCLAPQQALPPRDRPDMIQVIQYMNKKCILILASPLAISWGIVQRGQLALFISSPSFTACSVKGLFLRSSSFHLIGEGKVLCLFSLNNNNQLLFNRVDQVSSTISLLVSSAKTNVASISESSQRHCSPSKVCTQTLLISTQSSIKCLPSLIFGKRSTVPPSAKAINDAARR